VIYDTAQWQKQISCVHPGVAEGDVCGGCGAPVVLAVRARQSGSLRVDANGWPIGIASDEQHQKRRDDQETQRANRLADECGSLLARAERAERERDAAQAELLRRGRK